MQNRVSKIRFKRSAAANKALMRGMFRNLLDKKMITTTEPKAKALKSYTDKVISRGKRKAAFTNKTLLNWVSPSLYPKLKKVIKKYEKRVGGYTRVLKIEMRRSDGAKMAIIKFVK